MSATTKERWKKEIDCLVSVTDYIVEFVTTQQKSKDGSIIEVTKTQLMNLFFITHFLITIVDQLCSVGNGDTAKERPSS